MRSHLILAVMRHRKVEWRGVTPTHLPSGVTSFHESRSVPHRITMVSCNCTPYLMSKVIRCDTNPVSCNWGQRSKLLLKAFKERLYPSAKNWITAGYAWPLVLFVFSNKFSTISRALLMCVKVRGIVAPL